MRAAKSDHSDSNSSSREVTESALKIESYRGADHGSIQRFLLDVLGERARDAFLSSLDDPFFEPQHRLLARHDERVVSHVHLTQRVMRIGEAFVPACGVEYLATAADFRGRGLSRRLLAAAEQRAQDGGASLGFLTTTNPAFFEALDWVNFGPRESAKASAHWVLGRLAELAPEVDSRKSAIRPFRHIELPALTRLYDAHGKHTAGSLARTEAYWRWLLSRNAFEQILVAVEGAAMERPEHRANVEAEAPEGMESSASSFESIVGRERAQRKLGRIVAYMVVDRNRVLELVVAPGFASAGARLLTHVCGEAIERDMRSIRIDGEEGDPLRALGNRSANSIADGATGWERTFESECRMVKVINPFSLARELRETWRAAVPPLKRGESRSLGLWIGPTKILVEFDRRGTRLSQGKIGRDYLKASPAEFTRLALGRTSLKASLERGDVHISSAAARRIGELLFVRRMWWAPPLDGRMG